MSLFTARIFSIIGLGFILSTFGVSAATIVWSGADLVSLNTNWSDTANWVGGVVPTSTSDVKFFDGGGVTAVSNINNIVDSTTTILSLQYGNTNNNHTTFINSGAALNVFGGGGTAGILLVGTTGGAGGSTAQLVNSTVTGPGALVVSNGAGFLVINQGAPSTASQRSTLDLTGLNTFSNTVRNVFIGSTGLSPASPTANGFGVTGTLLMAKTNVITVLFSPPGAVFPSNMVVGAGLQVGYNGAGNASSGPNYLYLGQNNTFNVDSMTFGQTKAPAAMAFAPNFTNSNPTAVFRGTNGGSTRVSYWALADSNPRGGTAVCLGTNDFRFGSLDAMVNLMVLGQDPYALSAVPTSTGTAGNFGVFYFPTGTLDVNILTLGNIQTTSASGGGNTDPSIGIMNVGANATLKINTVLQMTFTSTNSVAAQKSFGRLNVTNGTVLANNITVGAFGVTTNNAISLTNATLIVSNALASSAFPLTNYSTANSLLGLTLTSDSSTKASVGVLGTGGSTNVVQINSTPVFFASYPARIPLITYNSLTGSGYNFGLTNLPAWMANGFLSNNVSGKSVDLWLPGDPRPVITVQPTSYSGSPGDNVTNNFAVTIAATSVTPLSYQWYYYTNGGPTNLLVNGNGPSGTSTISGSTTTNLQMLNSTNTDSGNYFVVITNIYGSATSSASILTINAGGPPIISPVPQNQTVIQGNNATFTAGVSANPAATIYWQTGGTNIPGATSSTLVVPNVQYPANDGQVYYIFASNSIAVVSNSATLTVIVPPTITAQPVSLVVTNTQSASFSVTVTGDVPPAAYRWKKNGTPITDGGTISGSGTLTLSISAAAPLDIANYSVTITNLAGVTNSVSVSLTVNSTMSPATLSPTNSATGICYDTPLYITFSQTPVLRNAGKIKIFNITNSTTPVDTIDLGANVAGVQAHSPFSGDAQAFSYLPVIITGSTAAIYPHGGVMTSNQTYYVTLDNGTFADTAGAFFAGITVTNAWQFTTKPTGPVDPVNPVVAADGSGDFLTVQGAVDSLPVNGPVRRVINIRNGIYTEIVDVTKTNITFRGQSRTGTILGYANNATLQAAQAGSTHDRMAFKVNANDIAIENMIITNRTPQGGSQAEALMIESAAKRCIINNADIASRQDTILANVNSSQAFFNNTKVLGNFDYIWGGGNLYFNKCVLHTISGAGANNNLTAARTDTGGSLSTNTPWANVTNGLFSANGFSFVSCTLEADPGVTPITLAGSNGTQGGLDSWAFCLIDTNVYVNPAFILATNYVFWQYQNLNTNGNAIPNTTYTNLQSIGLTNNDPRLLAATNITTWFYGWTPQLAPNILSQPTNVTLHSGSATFSVGATGIPDPAYQWLSNGVPIPSATGASFTITNVQVSSAATYSVIVSNAAGSVTSSNATLTVNDSAPVANASAYSRKAGFSLKIAIPGDLATNWSDPDSDPVSLSGGISSTNGATVSYDNNYVYYVNPNDVADQINYTVGDGLGLSAAGVINVVIAADSTNQTQNITGTAVNLDGSVTISFAGIPNDTYWVEATTNLATPIWLPISTNEAGTNGLWQFTDTQATNYLQRFYRTSKH